MSHLKVIWNNGASLHLAEVLGLEYVDETYKALSNALLFFDRVQKAKDDEKVASARIKVSDWKNFAAIFLASHLAWSDANKQNPEHDFLTALGYVQSNPSVIVEVLTLAIATFPKAKDEEEGEATA